MITNSAGVVLRLPEATPLDASPHVQRVNDSPAEEMCRCRGWGDVALALGGLPEEQAEPRAGGGEV